MTTLTPATAAADGRAGRRHRRLLNHGEARYRRWLAQHPDTPAGNAALLLWLAAEGVPVVGLGPARIGISGLWVECWYPTPTWMVAAIGETKGGG